MTFQPRYIVLHHSATDPTASLEDIKLAHLSRGFDDIGYHWLIYEDGSIRSARPENIEGAHALGFNSESIGICLIGNYNQSTLNKECLSTLIKLLYLLCSVYKISIENILTHQAVDKKLNSGRKTECPGQNIISELSNILSIVNNELVSLPLYQADFRASFILEPPYISKLVILSGRLYNVGLETWESDITRNDFPYRIGIKVFNNENKLIWEGREVITKTIASGNYFDFITIIPRINLATGVNRVVLAVVKEGCFWFNESGDSSFEIELDLSEEYHDNNSKNIITKYSQRFTDFKLSLNSENKIEIKANLLNSGSIAWDNTIKNSANIVGAYDLLIKITSITNQSYSHEELINLPAIMIEPGMKVPITTEITMDKVPFGNYLIHFDVVKHSKFRFSELGHNTAVLGFWFHEDNQIPVPIAIKEEPIEKTGFEATLHDFSINFRYGFILGLKGKLENTGTKEWNNITDLADKPTRLGIRLFSLNGERRLAWESRFNLPHKYIQPKEILPIEIDFNLFGLSAGSYEVIVDVVKDRCFWFSNSSEVGLFQTAININEQANTRSLISEINYEAKTKASEVKVLVVAPTLPLFDRETGGKRLLAILKLLREQGFELQFTYEEPGLVVDVDRYLSALNKLGITIHSNPTGVIADLTPNSIDVALLCWHACASRHIDLIRITQPKAKVIIDTVDVHWVRESRGVEAGELGFTESDLQQRKSSEIEVYRKADVIWVVTEDDRQALHTEIPDSRSVIVSNMSEKFTNFSDNKNADGMLFLGGFNHPPNEQAALRAYEAINEYRRRVGNNIKFYIVGSNPTDAIKAIHDGKLNIVCGYVENLDEYYKSCRALIAPITYGAGIKGKVCDAICAGLAVITSKLGNEGLNLIDRKEIFLAENIDDYVCAIDDIFSDRFDLDVIKSKALEKVLRITGYESARKPITYSLIVPPVTVAIVSYNKCHLLDKLLDSLFKLTYYPDLLVSVWLNGCKDGSLELVEEFSRLYPDKFEFHYNTENEFFVRPNNKIIEKHLGRDIVLVNNDIEIISKDWLLELQQAAYTSDFVGAAGGKILDENRIISEAGAIIYDTGLGENIGRGAPENSKEFDLVRYVGFVSGCMLYMRRDMIDKYGAFDDDFHPMYYEDCEWQYRLHLHGIRSIYTPRAKAIHREGSSAGTDTSKGMKRYQEINRSKFLSKFAGHSITALNKI
jgi:GT2 family glycosyltransferase